MLTNHSGCFQKFEIWILVGIWSNTWWAKIQKIEATVIITVPVRPRPVAMPWTLPLSSPASPAPTQAVRNGEGEGEHAWTPPLCLSHLCTMPTVVASPTPTHSAPTPRPNPSSMPPRPPCPALPVHVARTPCAGHPLDALVPALLAYKKPLRSRSWTHPTPSELPDIFSSSRSISFAIASSAGELLGMGGTAAFGLRWANGRREVEEECRRSLFRPAPSSSASPSRLAVAVVFFSARRWAPALADEHDGRAPLDTNPAAAYRFGALNDLTCRTHLSDRFQTYSRPGRSGTGPARSGLFRIWPGSVRFGPNHFFYFPLILNCFKYVLDMIFKL
jgi:hypothetical protein